MGGQEFSGSSGEKDRAWLSWRELLALVAFLVFVGGLVVWTTADVPGHLAEFTVELFVPALASSNAANPRPGDRREAP